VSVYGFGGDDGTNASLQGLAMICDVNNISLSNERYDLNQATAYDSMTSLTGSPIIMSGLKVLNQRDTGVLITNSTYWMLHINLTTNPSGICNGTVVFAAESP
jgi:hypothetical protein